MPCVPVFGDEIFNSEFVEKNKEKLNAAYELFDEESKRIFAGCVDFMFGGELDKLKEITNLITEGIMTGIDMYGGKKIGLILIAFYIIGYILSAVQGLIMANVTQGVANELRSDISVKINRLPMWFYNKTSTGDILSRVTNDVDMIGMSLHQSVGNLVSSIILFLGSLIMMFVTNWIMALAALVSTALGFSIMSIIMKKSQKYFVEQQNRLGDLNGIIEESYSGQTVIKTYNAKNEFKSKFEKANKKLARGKRHR